MKKKKYLRLYKRWATDGNIGHDVNGLCNYFGTSVGTEFIPNKGEELFELMMPTHKSTRGRNGGYWGTDAEYQRMNVFCPLRQNIVLFMAAMNNEL